MDLNLFSTEPTTTLRNGSHVNGVELDSADLSPTHILNANIDPGLPASSTISASETSNEDAYSRLADRGVIGAKGPPCSSTLRLGRGVFDDDDDSEAAMTGVVDNAAVVDSNPKGDKPFCANASPSKGRHLSVGSPNRTFSEGSSDITCSENTAENSDVSQEMIESHHSENDDPADVYGHAMAVSSSPDMTQSCSSSGVASPREVVPRAAPLFSADPAAASVEDRETALGHRGSVELTKSEEDLFREVESLPTTLPDLVDDKVLAGEKAEVTEEEGDDDDACRRFIVLDPVERVPDAVAVDNLVDAPIRGVVSADDDQDDDDDEAQTNDRPSPTDDDEEAKPGSALSQLKKNFKNVFKEDKSELDDSLEEKSEENSGSLMEAETPSDFEPYVHFSFDSGGKSTTNPSGKESRIGISPLAREATSQPSPAEEAGPTKTSPLLSTVRRDPILPESPDEASVESPESRESAKPEDEIEKARYDDPALKSDLEISMAAFAETSPSLSPSLSPTARRNDITRRPTDLSPMSAQDDFTFDDALRANASLVSPSADRASNEDDFRRLAEESGASSSAAARDAIKSTSTYSARDSFFDIRVDESSSAGEEDYSFGDSVMSALKSTKRFEPDVLGADGEDASVFGDQTISPLDSNRPSTAFFSVTSPELTPVTPFPNSVVEATNRRSHFRFSASETPATLVKKSPEKFCDAEAPSTIKELGSPTKELASPPCNDAERKSGQGKGRGVANSLASQLSFFEQRKEPEATADNLETTTRKIETPVKKAETWAKQVETMALSSSTKAAPVNADRVSKAQAPPAPRPSWKPSSDSPRNNAQQSKVREKNDSPPNGVVGSEEDKTIRDLEAEVETKVATGKIKKLNSSLLKIFENQENEDGFYAKNRMSRSEFVKPAYGDKKEEFIRSLSPACNIAAPFQQAREAAAPKSDADISPRARNRVSSYEDDVEKKNNINDIFKFFEKGGVVDKENVGIETSPPRPRVMTPPRVEENAGSGLSAGNIAVSPRNGGICVPTKASPKPARMINGDLRWQSDIEKAPDVLNEKTKSEDFLPPFGHAKTMAQRYLEAASGHLNAAVSRERKGMIVIERSTGKDIFVENTPAPSAADFKSGDRDTRLSFIATTDAAEGDGEEVNC